MNRLITIVLFAAALPFFTHGQAERQPGMHHAKATPKGEGKIDTRVDNMRYWRMMADSGFVVLSPMQSVPPAIYKGSIIESPMVMTSNSPDVPTTTVNSTQSENSVFINPADSNSVMNSNNSTTNPVGSLYGADYLLSSDGGATWGGSVQGAGGSNSGDPTTAISLDNRYYIGFINAAGGQSVSYSTNSGSTWTPVVAGIKPSGSGNLLDKNHMWIDNSPSSPYDGNLYNAWTCIGGTNDAEIEFARSTDGGLSWSTQTAISTAVAAGSHNQGVNVQTGPDGKVYVVWTIYDNWPSDEDALGFAKSTNGGASFAPATRILSNIRGIRYSETSKNQRVNSFPSMAVDISGGDYNGNIYVVWTNIGVPGVNTGSDIDIYMIKSDDEGVTWSTPIRVNQDPTGLGNEHYFPWITCDPVTGDLCVIFYDDRNVSSTQCEVFIACSFDGGDTWADFKVSDVAFTPAPIPNLATGYMGDYLGIASLNGKVYPTWADNRTGVVKTYVSPFLLTKNPEANFTVDENHPCLNEAVTFEDLSIKYPTSWTWSISPAGYSYVNSTGPNSQNPQVSFNSLGNYTVQLIVANSNGADTLTRNGFITVNSANPDFSANLTQINVGNSVTFSDQTTCTATSYLWNFGAGAVPSTASTAGPHIVTYSTPGIKTVTLTVNDSIIERKSKYIIVDAAYCTASANCDEYISNVTIGSINNSSTCTSGGYKKYTQYFTTLSPGTGYPVTVVNGLPYVGDQCQIWVDWNQDLDFSDAGETITMSGSPGGGPYTGTITPPSGALAGLTRMRARIIYTGTIAACGSSTYGETEDYSFYIGTPGLWEGGVPGAETDWNTAGNWDNGIVPSASVNVVIPDGLEHYPVVAGTLNSQNLTIADGASLTVQPAATLNIQGNLNVGNLTSGTLVINGGTCNVQGAVVVNPGSTIELVNGGVMNEN